MVWLYLVEKYADTGWGIFDMVWMTTRVACVWYEMEGLHLSVLILSMIQELISSKVKTRGNRTGGGGLGLSPQSLGNLNMLV